MRLGVIKTTYLLIIFFIILRLGYWQIVLSDHLTAMGEGQRFVTKEVDAPRGSILFNDNSVLAASKPIYLIYAQPKFINTQKGPSFEEITSYKKQFANKLAPIFYKLDSDLNKEHVPESSESAALMADEKQKELFEKTKIKEIEDYIFTLVSKDLFWVSLGRKVDVKTKKEIESLNLIGVGFDHDTTRSYPEGSSSANLLGFVGSDAYGSQTGYFGLEGFYDGELKGKKGVLRQENDAFGLPILIGKFINKEPRTGKTVVTNIDRTVQHMAEEKLKLGMEKYKAKGGSVIIMEPKTGNILAMASYPNYHPSVPWLYPTQTYRNPITADGYEPGSTFKVLVMAAAINENLVKPDTICDICSGPINLAGFTIRTWNNQYESNATMKDVIIHSDNTGMVFIARKMGVEKMFQYIQKFGFGQPTGVDLQDETSPNLREYDTWKEIDLATASFGQGISVTALQVVRAVAVIANGGYLMEPHVASEINEDDKIQKIQPRVIDQPISSESAKIVTDMMVAAVDEGEAKSFKPKGYKIAGKTGTAQIAVAGHYDATKTIASFVGFAPADNPKFVMLVRYTEPASSIFGAETAAPTFFDISKELFTYYGIPPSE